MLPDTGTLLHWVSVYGYPCLGATLLLAAAGLPIPIELVLLALGGLSATHGGPDFLALCALGIVATVAGDALDYGIGRLLREQGLERLPEGRFWRRWRRMLDDASAMKQGEGVWGLAVWSGSGVMIFLSRCVLTPLEAPLSLLAGARRMPLARFLAWDTLGEAVYVAGCLTLGYTGAASLATSGPLLVVAGGALVLATLGPLVAVRLIARGRRQKQAPDTRAVKTRDTKDTEDTKSHGEREAQCVAGSSCADAA